MNRFQRTLQVFANPFAAIDHKGRAAGACPCDPSHNPDRAFVGAKIDPTKTRLLRRKPKQGDDLRSVPQDTVFEFSAEPVTVPLTRYYVKRIQTGELIAADLATAARAGIAAKNFVEPKKLLANLKAAAIATFDREYGEGAFAFLEKERAEREAREAEAAKAAQSDGEATAAPTAEQPTETNPTESGTASDDVSVDDDAVEAFNGPIDRKAEPEAAAEPPTVTDSTTSRRKARS